MVEEYRSSNNIETRATGRIVTSGIPSEPRRTLQEAFVQGEMMFHNSIDADFSATWRQAANLRPIIE
ncbi:MAG: hypothetical protein M3Q44_01165 [bacterium]|nr:hypothetical protein [bacterium]